MVTVLQNKPRNLEKNNNKTFNTPTFENNKDKKVYSAYWTIDQFKHKQDNLLEPLKSGHDNSETKMVRLWLRVYN